VPEPEARCGGRRGAAAAWRAGLCLAAWALAAGCGGAESGDARIEAADERESGGPAAGAGTAAMADSSGAIAMGGHAASRLAGGLIGPLTAAVEAGGPAGAIDFCSREAAALTSAIEDSIGGGITLKRTTLQPRNPDNAPDELERRVLEDLHARVARGDTLPSHVLQAEAGAVRYYRPLTVQALCVRCHGAAEQLDPAVRTMLAQRYPADQATGYREGDLRGVIRVRMPAAAR
jgi:hypothetical protein